MSAPAKKTITLDDLALAYGTTTVQPNDESFFKPMVYTGPVNPAAAQESKEEANKISQLGEIVNSIPDHPVNTTVEVKETTPEKPKEPIMQPNILDSIVDPNVVKADVEKKQHAMKLELEARGKKLIRQKELIEKINGELNALDVPLTKEIGILRDKIDTCDRQLNSANLVYLEKQKEFKEADKLVQELGERKTKLTEHLQLIMYDFESRKQQKLKELEAELRNLEK
ncbi:hypothetical protein WA158_007269 [Blastocystis sp. Blastoise]